jgi:tRNA pseudouridine55 synthase
MGTETIQTNQVCSWPSGADRPGAEPPKQPSCKPVNGLLLLDKPAGITSFSAAARVRKLLRVEKVGHCGTLDPFATGLLLVCINQATRVVDQLMVQDKIYRCRVRLGVETDTLDHTGEVTAEYSGDPCHDRDLREVLVAFVGVYEQVVPRYSAVRVQGRRLHQWARQGVEVAVPSREVQISSLELLSYRWPEAVLEVHCSKGTYIRQLAADIGRRLNCGAHLTELRRLGSGRFSLEQAIRMEQLESVKHPGEWFSALVPMNAALDHLPAIVVDDASVLEALNTMRACWKP